MQDLQFARTLTSKPNTNSSVLGIWLFPITKPLKKITPIEEKWANILPARKQREYKYSRSYVRFALSTLFGIEPLKIPLFAPPGKPPKLAKGWGYMNLSHCNNALLIGWSSKKIGVDIENANRSFNAIKLAERICSTKENKLIKDLEIEEIRKIVLSRWIAKEAAFKWQQGVLYKDLNQWQNNENTKIYTNKKEGKQVFIDLIDIDSWKIGIAYDKNIHPSSPIICFDK